MPLGREAAHIVADLGDDERGAEVTDARDRGQEGDRRAKGLDIGVDLPIDLRNRRVDGVDLLEVQSPQEAVVLGHPAAPRLAKFLRRRLDPAMRQPSQCVGIA